VLAEHSFRSGDGSGLSAVETTRRARFPSLDWENVRASFVPFAFTEAVCIRDPLDQRVRINFIRHHGQASEAFSDLSVTVKLSNGKDLVAYRLSGSIPSDIREQVQNILNFAESREISPLHAARGLVSVTTRAPNAAWIPERILDRELNETVVPPMGYAIPSFNEYLANPECASSRFFSAKIEGGNHVRLESHISVDMGCSILDLSTTDANDKVQKQLFEIVSDLDRDLHTDEDIRRDLLLKTYKAMEVFWNQGSDELRKHLLITDTREAPARGQVEAPGAMSENDPLTDTLIANGSIELPTWDISYDLSSGAILHFAAGRHFALLTLHSNAGESPSVYSWVFRDEEGDLSEPSNPQRKAILGAMRQFATYESDEVRLDALQRLRELKAAIPMPLAPALDTLIGSDLAFALSAHPAVDISPVVPGDAEDIVRMARGIDSVRLSFSDRRLKKTSPQLLDQIDVDLSPEGSLEIIAVNRLGGRLTAFISKEALEQAGDRDVFLQALVNAMGSQSSLGIRVVQTLLSNAIVLDEDASWMSMSGDPYACSLPHVDDIEGQRMYNVGTLLIKKYAEISCGSPEDCRLHYLDEGKVAVTLGLPSEPYQLCVWIDHGRVTQLEVTPNLRVDDTTHRPDFQKSRRYVCDLGVMTSQEDRSTLVRAFHLFDSLLASLAFPESAPVGLDFDRSELRSFLDQRFGLPRRHAN
jgi:hypothetical protein